jgi:hypothetical protein
MNTVLPAASSLNFSPRQAFGTYAATLDVPGSDELAFLLYEWIFN